MLRVQRPLIRSLDFYRIYGFSNRVYPNQFLVKLKRFDDLG